MSSLDFGSALFCFTSGVGSTLITASNISAPFPAPCFNVPVHFDLHLARVPPDSESQETDTMVFRAGAVEPESVQQ